MFRFDRWFDSPSVRSTRNRTRLVLERLETRDCPAAPALNFTATPVNGNQVEISGTVQDENPSTVTITFDGVANYTITADANGNFGFTTTVTGEGAIRGTALDEETLYSPTMEVLYYYPSNSPPVISNFQALPGTENIWTFQGQVTDDKNPAGLVVTLGGIPSLKGVTAVVDHSGWFHVSVRLLSGEHGTATAQTVDREGLASNVAYAIVDVPSA